MLTSCAVVVRYGDGTARATVEGNILFPFIPEDKLEDLKVCHIPFNCSILKNNSL